MREDKREERSRPNVRRTASREKSPQWWNIDSDYEMNMSQEKQRGRQRSRQTTPALGGSRDIRRVKSRYDVLSDDNNDKAFNDIKKVSSV